MQLIVEELIWDGYVRESSGSRRGRCGIRSDES